MLRNLIRYAGSDTLIRCVSSDIIMRYVESDRSMRCASSATMMRCVGSHSAMRCFGSDNVIRHDLKVTPWNDEIVSLLSYFREAKTPYKFAITNRARVAMYRATTYTFDLARYSSTQIYSGESVPPPKATINPGEGQTTTWATDDPFSRGHNLTQNQFQAPSPECASYPNPAPTGKHHPTTPAPTGKKNQLQLLLPPITPLASSLSIVTQNRELCKIKIKCYGMCYNQIRMLKISDWSLLSWENLQ